MANEFRVSLNFVLDFLIRKKYTLLFPSLFFFIFLLFLLFFFYKKNWVNDY